MKALVLGEGGQLSTELLWTKPDGVGLYQAGQDEFDLRSPEKIEELLEAHLPDVVINAAAYTAVDKAEVERELADLINGHAVGVIASACAKAGARLLHVSTDFVFDGSKANAYQPDDSPNPLGVYGESKLKGEQLLLKALPEGGAIVRTSWLYSSHGNNFVKTMLRLMAEKEQLRVVHDQIGSPTWARGLAQVLWKLSFKRELCGIFHWSDLGEISWYDFSLAIQQEALSVGILDRKISVEPIPSHDYPTPARRPAYSVLDCTKTVDQLEVSQGNWRDALVEMLKVLKEDLS